MVVIVLVAAGLVFFNISNSAGSVFSSAGKIASSSGSISISDAVIDADGNGLFLLRNNSGDMLNVVRLSLDGVDLNYPQTIMSVGDEKVFGLSDLGNACSCNGYEGKSKTCNLIVYSQSQNYFEKKYEVKVSVDCVVEAVPINPNTVVNPIEANNGNIVYFESCWNDVTNPHPICNCFDLNNVRNHLDWDYEIQNDINFNVSECAIFQTGYDFLPIGINAAPFTGEFNGVNKRITNLFIFNAPLYTASLFGVVDSASIHNVVLSDVNVYGWEKVAGLVGIAQNSTIYEISVSGSIRGIAGVGAGIVGDSTNSSISRSANFASVLGPGPVSMHGQTGGIVGYGTDTNIIYCYNDGMISSEAWEGGIAGELWGASNVTNSYNSGYVGNTSGPYIGGLVGGINGTTQISFSFNVGTVSAAGWQSPGGIVSSISGGTLNLVYWDTVLSGQTHCYSSNTCDNNFTSNNASYYYNSSNLPLSRWDFMTTWIEQDNNYPKLAWLD